jgi:hypothetical protein
MQIQSYCVRNNVPDQKRERERDSALCTKGSSKLISESGIRMQKKKKAEIQYCLPADMDR